MSLHDGQSGNANKIRNSLCEVQRETPFQKGPCFLAGRDGLHKKENQPGDRGPAGLQHGCPGVTARFRSEDSTGVPPSPHHLESFQVSGRTELPGEWCILPSEYLHPCLL